MRTELAIALLVAGCSSATRYGGASVDVSVTAPAALAASIESLSVSVSGADSLSFAVPATLAGAPQSVVYRARAASGTLHFTVGGRDGAGHTVGSASGSVTLRAGSQTLTLALTNASSQDFGTSSDGSAVDMTFVDAAIAPLPTIAPSHVGGGTFQPGAAPLSDVSDIDTTALTLRIAGNTDAGYLPPPPGVSFVSDSGYAVLSVGDFTVDRELFVHGGAGLVVVSSGNIVVEQLIHVEAHGLTSGPGGGNTSTIAGNGGVGEPGGGGGAGHGTAGAVGGHALLAGTGGTGGPPFSLSVADLLGGAVGGDVDGKGNPPMQCQLGTPLGGGGGGILQLSSSHSITILFQGGVSAGGGGGGICNAAQRAGGGGGSGGEIFLEAPSITVRGWLAANGGAGAYPSNAGDALVSTTAAAGGAAPLGNGGTATTAPQSGSPAGNNANATTGGGGAVGIIWLRTAGAMPDVGGAQGITPAPMLDGNLH